jgi:hypothetical protein
MGDRGERRRSGRNALKRASITVQLRRERTLQGLRPQELSTFIERLQRMYDNVSAIDREI